MNCALMSSMIMTTMVRFMKTMVSMMTMTIVPRQEGGSAINLTEKGEENRRDISMKKLQHRKDARMNELRITEDIA